MNDGQFADPDSNPYAYGNDSYGQQDGNPYPNPYTYGYGQLEAKPEPSPAPYPYGYAEQEVNQYLYNNGQSSSDPMASNASSPSYTLAPPPPHLPDYPTLEQQHYQPSGLQPNRRRPHLGIVLVMLVLLIGVGVGSLLLLSHSRSTAKTNSASTTNPITNNSNAGSSGQTTLTVTVHPTIVIENDAGSIRVRAGAASNKVILQPSNSGSTTGSTAIPYTETSDLSTIVIYLSSPNSSNLDVTVPVTSDLKLYTNENNIFVNGVKGQMNLGANTGTITVSYSTINTASIIDDNSGAITAVRDSLNGDVTLLNNSGTITFSGAINPSGIYQFIGNGGLIDITLPHDGAFHVDATANNSTVSSNFPGVVVQNGEIHANSVHSPRAKVTINNNNGAVALHAGNGS